MAFRDDLSAAHARVESLEREVASLKVENEELRGDRPAANASSSTRLQVMLAVFLISALAAGALISFVLGAVAVAAVAAVAGVLFLVTLVVVSSLLEVVPPGFALVISGRQQVENGISRGFRVVTGGRVLRLPIIEVSESLDLRPRRIAAEHHNVYVKDNLRTTVRYTASVRIADSRPTLDNAIERFLGREPEEVDRVARECLEGHIRAVCAARELPELVADTERFARELEADARESLTKLGLIVEVSSIEVVERGGS